MFAEALGVQRGGSNNELQVAPLRQQLLEVAEQEIDEIGRASCRERVS
jgi:hypothetical protein